VSAVDHAHRTVFEVGAALAAQLDVEQALAAVARGVGEALAVDSCDISIYDAAREALIYTCEWGPGVSDAELAYVGTVVKRAERPGRFRVIDERRLVVEYLDDADLDPEERRVMEYWHEHASMEIPLIFNNEVIGLLGVCQTSGPRRFSDEEQELMRMLAVPAAVAIHNARVYTARREGARRLETLLEASRVLSSTPELDEVLAELVRQAVTAVGCSQSAIYEYEAARDALVYRALCERTVAPGAAPDDALGTAYRLSEYPGERAILQGRRVVVEHASDTDLPPDRRNSMLAWGERTCLTVPLWFGAAPVGLIRVYEMEREREFTEDEVELLRGLAELAAAAINTTRLYDRQRERSRRLRDVVETTRALVGTLEAEAVLDRLARGSESLIPADEPRARVTMLADLTGDHADGSGRGAPDAGGLLAPAQETGESRSALQVPLVAKGAARGVLEVTVRGRRRFSEGEVEALQVLANQAGVALENARLYRRVREQAIRDGLTGLFNHRHFQERLRDECARALRYELPLSLLMFDIDDFKRFNDEFGHQRGDEVLREVAALLGSGIRRGIDLPARYGGEEFAVILPHTAIAGAEVLGHRLRGELAAADLPPRGADAALVGERLRKSIATSAFAGRDDRHPSHVSVSVGVAMSAAGSRGAEDLVAAADRALYRAKRAGKDRVEVEPG
jgi:diguanylate cyclase (GGDEF)-like protein